MTIVKFLTVTKLYKNFKALEFNLTIRFEELQIKMFSVVIIW
jgi:hypothetical protein